MLAGKTILVFGVGPGLGGECARLVMRDGGNVVLAARTEAKLEAFAAELDPTGERVAFKGTDMMDQAAVEAVVAHGVERFGGIDGLIMVAADDSKLGGLAETTDAEWQRILTNNVVGTVHVVNACAQAMRAQGGGSIVLIGSQSSFDGTMRQTAYAASKGALRAAIVHMVEELGPDKIRVNNVVPTWMWGPPVQMYVQWQAGERGCPEQDVIDEITANMPLGEIPADEDVAEAAIWMCSDRARMVTGQTLFVNAGEHMRS